MSEFKRKSQSGGFEAGEQRPSTGEGSEAARPDFSDLEAESGFSAGEPSGGGIRRAEAPEPKPAAEEAGDIFSPIREEPNRVQPAPTQPAQATPGKKRYYNPGEVMKKKGCIGCGGMVLAVPAMLAILVLVVVVF